MFKKFFNCNHSDLLSINNTLVPAFSLIELMVVIAITAVLVAVAIPNYKAYVVRTQVTAMIATIDFCQNDIFKSFVNTGSFPDLATQTVTCQGINMRPNVMSTIPNTDNQMTAGYNRSSDGNTAGFTLQHTQVVEKNQGTARICNLYIVFNINNGEINRACSTNCTTSAFFPANCTTGVSINPFG